MMSESDYQIIERYLNGELAEGERLEFEQRLATDQQLASEVAIAKDMNLYVENKEKVAAVNATIHEFSQKYRKPQEAKVIPFYKRRKVIIGIAMGMASIFLLFLFSDLFTNDPYQEFFQHQKLSGEQGSSEANLKQTIKDFNQEKYQASVRGLEKIDVATKLENPELILAQGISYMEINEFDSASQILNQLIQGHPIYTNQGNWYLALNALKQEKYQDCRDFLSKISSDSSYAKKANRLLEIISSKLG